MSRRDLVNLDQQINMEYLSADEASRILGVQKATLYAYVSRGLLSSLEGPDRESRYRWEDIERLRQRKVGPRQAASEALYGGLPSLTSRISQIEGGRLYYRQQPIEQLLASPDLPRLASLLWTGQADYPVGRLDGDLQPAWSGPFLPTAWQWLAEQWQSDPRGWDPSPEGFRASGWRIFHCFYRRLEPHPRLHEALVATADHELNPSALTARIAASTGSNPYAVVSAALATFSGSRHGGACKAVQPLVQQVRHSGHSPRQVLLEHLQRGGSTLGFGHPLYPQGDPRARWLLSQTAEGVGWEQAGLELLGHYPSIDLALAVVGFPDPLAVFATGRVLGWIAHALEQLEDGRIIRPRAQARNTSS